MIDLKKELYKQCLDYVHTRMEAAQLAITEAQNASNDDTKSSAGDKYETGRAMMQQEKDRNLLQLNEANKLKVALNKISADHTSSIIDAGSLVITNNEAFYLAISAGMISVDNEKYYAVSPGSPIGLKLKGHKKGDEFFLNGKHYEVKLVV